MGGFWGPKTPSRLVFGSLGFGVCEGRTGFITKEDVNVNILPVGSTQPCDAWTNVVEIPRVSPRKSCEVKVEVG